MPIFGLTFCGSCSVKHPDEDDNKEQYDKERDNMIRKTEMIITKTTMLEKYIQDAREELKDDIKTVKVDLRHELHEVKTNLLTLLNFIKHK